MSSLASCIKKASIVISKEDAASIRQIHDDLVAAGMKNPAQAAIDEFLQIVQNEQAVLVDQIEALGGRVPPAFSFAKETHKDIAERISVLDLLDGDELLTVPEMKMTKGTKKSPSRMKATAKNLALALVARAKKGNRGRALDSMTPRTKEILAEAIALETAAAMERSGNAGTWYTTVLENAVNIVSEIHPELKTDANARAIFMLGLAITSNGQEVSANAKTAEQQYAYFKKKGKFRRMAYGNQGNAMRDAFTVANKLIEKWGLDMFVKFLNTEFTVGELKGLGFEISGEDVGFKTHGSVIFGPKVGGGFYQNLMGNYDPVTMDRWFMRTWGRLTGTLMPDQTVLPDAQKQRFIEEVRNNAKKVRELGYTVKAVLESDVSLLQFAAVVHRYYAKTSSEWTSTYGEKTAFNKAGKNLDNAVNAPLIAPKSSAQRNWIREVTTLAIEKLNARGMPVNGASMQALIWYPEKDLYLKYGVGNAKSAPTDYEQEFAKIALGRGISQQRIDAARTSGATERSAGRSRDERGGARPGQSGEQGTAPPSLDTKGKDRLVYLENFRNLRHELPVSYRGSIPRGAQRVLDGVKVLRVLKPAIKVRNVLKKLGLAQPEYLEISGLEGAKVFSDAILSAKKNHTFGSSVYVYPEDNYVDMRMFITQDKKSGFALSRDGDIVSGFTWAKAEGELPGIANGMVMAAVSEGGVKLDAFDTVLPMMYSLHGFRAVSRISWNENEAPPDWDKKLYKDYNNGEPDVVFMVYDRNHRIGYTGQAEGQLVATYDEAVDLQTEGVKSLTQRNKKSINIQAALPEDRINNNNADPTSPDSIADRVAVTVEQQSAQAPDRPTMEQLREWATSKRENWDSAKAFLTLIPRRYLGDFLPKGLVPSIDEYLNLSARLDGRRNELQARAEEIARKWAKWANKNSEAAGTLSELMHLSTLSGVDVAKEFKPKNLGPNANLAAKREEAVRHENYRRLRSAWNGLPQEARDLYVEVRDDYIQTRKNLEEALFARIQASEADGKSKKQLIDELRMRFEKGRVQGVYFPLMRYGNIYGVAKNAAGDVVSYSRFESYSDLRVWREAQEEAGNVVRQGRRSEQSGEQIDKVDPVFAARVAQMLKGSNDPTMETEMWNLYLSSLPEMSMRKRYMSRKGRLGFAADALRGYANVSFRAANQQAKLEYMYRMEDALKATKKEVEALENNPDHPKDFKWAMPVYDEMAKRHKAQVNPEASSWAVKVTGAGFFWFLGITPAAAVVNLSQTPLLAFPVLTAEFNAAGAGAELLRASGTFASSRGPIENKLRGIERDAMAEARKIGMFDKTQAHDLAGVTESGAQNYGGAQHKFMTVVSYLFHKAEQLNREVTFLAAFRLGIRRGDTPADAVKMAEKLTWDSHFDYNNANRPVIMQSDIGRVVLLFKQYALNMTYRLVRDFRDGFLGNANVSAAEKSKAKQRFAGMMVMSMLLSGLKGLPGFLMMPIEFALNALFDDEDDPFDIEVAMRAYFAEMWGVKASQYIMDGPVDSSVGVTLSTRVSLGELWLRDQGVQRTGRSAMEHLILDFLGPIANTGMDVGGAIIDASSGDVTDWSRVAEKAMPKVARDAMRAYRYATEGALTQHIPGDVLVAKEDFNPLDVFWQAFGFTPAKLSLQYDQNAALRDVSMKLQKRRASLIDKYMLASYANDKRERKAATKEIAAWNRAQPGAIIEGEDLKRSSMSRARRNALSMGGVNLPRGQRRLYDELNFTNQERLDRAKEREARKK